MAVLVVVSGLPGVGKSAIAEGISSRVDMCLLELDLIEQPLIRHGIGGDAIGWAGYEALTALADLNLGLGRSVLLDSVAWTERLRRSWADLAARQSAGLRPIEVVCTDEAVHRRRLEERAEATTSPKARWADIDRVREAYWEPWEGKRLVLDSAMPLADLVTQAVAYVTRPVIAN